MNSILTANSTFGSSQHKLIYVKLYINQTQLKSPLLTSLIGFIVLSTYIFLPFLNITLRNTPQGYS